jgi:uncharacterized membrane protein
MNMSYFESARAELGEPTAEDRDYAFYALLFGAIGNVLSAGVLLPLFGAVLPLFLTRSRHPFVLFHVNQSFWYQLALFGLNGALFVIITVLAALTCGFGALLYALMIVPPIIGVVHPILVGLRVRDGAWEKLPYVGDWLWTGENPPFWR